MSRFLSLLIAAAFLAGGLALPASEASAAECKGLSRSRCEGSASCSWVNGHQRSNGSRVSAHRRAMPGKATKKSKAKRTTK